MAPGAQDLQILVSFVPQMCIAQVMYMQILPINERRKPAGKFTIFALVFAVNNGLLASFLPMR